VRPGHDADHSSPSSDEVVNEQELYLLSPQAPPWCVVGLLCIFYLNYCIQNVLLTERQSVILKFLYLKMYLIYVWGYMYFIYPK
jgi:hypothetical protein